MKRNKYEIKKEIFGDDSIYIEVLKNETTIYKTLWLGESDDQILVEAIKFAAGK